MGYIKSKFTGSAIFFAIFLLFFSLALVFAVVEDIKTFSGDYLRLLFLSVFLFLFIQLLKPYKYIIIKSNKLTYYSFIRPFGKTLHFSDYIGKIVYQESSSVGNYNVLYLIDKEYRTAFKIMGLHYKEIETIINTIPLKAMDFKPTIKESFKLFLFGRITIKEGCNDKKAEKKRDKFMNAIQIAGAIGLSLMVLGYLLRWILG